MKTLVLLGAPGAGKGSAADVLKAERAFVHVSTGDMLRDALRRGDPLGDAVSKAMSSGELVADELIFQLIDDRLQTLGPEASVMFDGMPRTIPQAEQLAKSLDTAGRTLDHVFYLEAAEDVVIKRLCSRLTCRSCGRIYNLLTLPPQQAGRCDECEGELFQRPDDSEATIRNRLVVFRRETQELISFYEGQGLLVRIDAGATVTSTVSEIASVLDRLPASP